MFLGMPRFDREILGDINPGVVQLWQTLAHERLSAVLAEHLARVPYDEDAFESAKNVSPETKLDCPRRGSLTVLGMTEERMGSPGSRAWNVHACPGSLTPPRSPATLPFAVATMLPSP